MNKLVLIAILMTGSLHASGSPLFDYSTDEKLMSDIKRLGSLENGLEVFAWNWTSEAGRLDKRYSSESGTDNYASVGLIAQNIQEKFPEVVDRGPDGYLRINPDKLAVADQFMRWKLSNTARTTQGRCAKILETQLILCF